MVLLVSCNFSPGHVNHLEAFARGFRELGEEVCFVLDTGYKMFAPILASLGDVHYTNGDVRLFQSIFSQHKECKLTLLMNPGLLNGAVAEVARTYGIRSAYLYHEPWRGFRFYAARGIKALFRAPIIRYSTCRLLHKVNHVIVPSDFALELYRARSCSKVNSSVSVIPLLLNDIYEGRYHSVPRDEKVYFAFIGKASSAHAFEDYVDFILYAASMTPDMRFLVATPSLIPYKTKKRLSVLEKHKVLEVYHGRPLGYDEINQFYKKSFVVWNVYEHSTQSGVLPVAFMHGTPVVACRTGSFLQYVIPTQTGEFVDRRDKRAILDVALLIRRRLEDYSIGARTMFVNAFYYRSHLNRLRELLS